MPSSKPPNKKATPLLIVLGVALAAWVIHLRMRPSDDSELGAPSAASSAPARPPAPPRAAGVRELEGCGCKVSLEGGVVEARLGVSSKGRAAGAPKSFDLEVYLLVGERQYKLSVQGETSPPSKVEGTLLGLAIACEGDVVAVVGPTSASGWSASNGDLMWTTQLPSPYATPRPGDGELEFRCHPVPSVEGVMSFTPEPPASELKLRVREGDLL